VPERWACQLVGQHRSTQRLRPVESDRDRALREALRRLSRAHPRWGYRRAHAQLLQQGWLVNRKAIQRLWREEGLRVPAHRRKRQRLGTSTTPADRLAAEHPDHVWALDYQFDQTEDGRRLKLLNVVDEHTREALTIEVARRIDADATVKALDRLVTDRGTVPRFIRCDNGPELTANALRDWCRFSGAGTSYIDPGSPWQNPYVESFGGRLRDELLAVEAFTTLLEAQVLVEDWRIEYNTIRPHSALGYLTPTTTPRPGPPPTPNSHSGWTNNRGPVTLSAGRPRSCRRASSSGQGPPPKPGRCRRRRRPRRCRRGRRQGCSTGRVRGGRRRADSGRPRPTADRAVGGGGGQTIRAAGRTRPVRCLSQAMLAVVHTAAPSFSSAIGGSSWHGCPAVTTSHSRYKSGHAL
jgi:putative transposase